MALVDISPGGDGNFRGRHSQAAIAAKPRKRGSAAPLRLAMRGIIIDEMRLAVSWRC